MSSTQNDRSFRTENGKTFPTESAPSIEERFADAIAEALRREYGQAPGAVKRVVLLTGANERAVRNWFEARNAPSGENLVTLLANSDEVLETVLRLSGRNELIKARKLTNARAQLEKMLAILDQIEDPDASR